MEKTLTPEERIAIISHAHKNSQAIAPKQSVEAFVADMKSEEVFSQHGLLKNQKADLEDESQFLNSDSAETIDEEDQSLGLSPAMRKVNGMSTEREYELDIGESANNLATESFNNREWNGQTEGKTNFTMNMNCADHINNKN